jgi:hypothetical protein
MIKKIMVNGIASTDLENYCQKFFYLARAREI